MSQEQQQQIAALQLQLQQLQQATAAIVASNAAELALVLASVPAHSRLIRLDPLAPFDGSSTGIKVWLTSLRQQCTYYRTNTEAGVLHFAAAHLQGAALEWWNHSSASGAAPST